MKANEVEVKKPKLEVKDEPGAADVDAKLEKLMVTQNKDFFKNRDGAEKSLSTKEMASLLRYNHQDVPEGKYLVCSDVLMATYF